MARSNSRMDRLARIVARNPQAMQGLGLSIFYIIRLLSERMKERKLKREIQQDARRKIQEALRQLDKAQWEIEAAIRREKGLRRILVKRRAAKLLEEIESKRKELQEALERM